MTSQQSELLNACQKGDLKAISSVVRQTFGKQNIRAQVSMANTSIVIRLHSDKSIPKDKVINWLSAFFSRLQPTGIERCRVEFTNVRDDYNKWTYGFEIVEKSNAANAENSKQIVESPPKNTEMAKSSIKKTLKTENPDKLILSAIPGFPGKPAKVITGCVLLGMISVIFTHIWSEYLGPSSRENEVLNEYLEALKPSEKNLLAAERSCLDLSTDKVVSISPAQVIQDPSLCPGFERGLASFCEDYPTDDVCRAKSLRDFCRKQPSDILCVDDD